MLAYSFKAKLTTIIALSMMAPIAWGQSVSAPSDQAQQTVVVKRGDSLWSISKKYGCSIADIKAVNQLNRDTVVLGQKLIIPAAGDTNISSEGTALGTPAAASAKPQYVIHVVESGETLRTICDNYGADVAQFLKVNKIGKGFRLVVGAKLKIPQNTTGHVAPAAPKKLAKEPVTTEEQTADISPDGTSLLGDDANPASASNGGDTISPVETHNKEPDSDFKPPSDLDNWINEAPDNSEPNNPSTEPPTEPKEEPERPTNLLNNDGEKVDTSSNGANTTEQPTEAADNQTKPEVEEPQVLVPDHKGAAEDTKPGTTENTDTSTPVEPNSTTPKAEEPAELPSTDDNGSSGNSATSVTSSGTNLLPSDGNNTSTPKPEEPEPTTSGTDASSGATVLTPDLENSASESSATVLTPDDTDLSPTGVGGVPNLLNDTKIEPDVVTPVVKKNQPLVTNVFMDTDIKQVLADIASVAHVVIIADDSVKPQNISIEFNKEPLDTALEKVALSGGLVWKERSDGVFLVSAGTPDSPLFREFAVTKRYMPSNMSAEALGELLSTSWKNYVKVDKAGNMITITAPQAVASKIEQDLQLIDAPLRQIVVDAVIIEMTADSGTETGFSWNMGKTGVSSDQEISYAKATELDFVKLKSLLSNGQAKMMANPRVSCFEGRETSLTVGKETYYTMLTGNNYYASTQIQKIPTGITLKVTVYVAADGFVTMKLDPEVGDFTTSVSGSPTVTIRRASTTMRVKNGDTLVIGGLVQELESKNKNKIPVLGDLPLVGELFKSSSTSKSRTDVVMLITPHVTDDGAGSAAETLRKLGVAATKP